MIKPEKSQAVLIGVWGLSRQELLMGVQAGELTFLKTLLTEGVLRSLEPTLPRYLSVAWATWLSGQNPGRHGVFNDKKGNNPVSAWEDPPFLSLGHILANNGYNIGFFNLPLRLEHKSDGKLRFLPLKRVPGENREQELEEWGKGFSAFVQTEGWDFLAASLDFNCLLKEQKDVAFRLSLIKKWDNDLAKGLSSYYPHINFLLLGASKPFLPEGFFLEQFLEEQGFLKKKVKRGGEIDDHNTLAYPAGEREIKINLKGREPQGKVEPGKEYEDLRAKITKKLMDIYGREQATYKLKIYPKEDLFSGEFFEGAPDLLLDFQDMENQGFFAFSGSPFTKAGEIAPLQGIDIAPTILYLMGQEIPPPMEGRIIKEAFAKDFLQSHPPRLASPKADKREGVEASAEKLDRIIERLKGLGYLT